jgi:hypothetical protein
MSTNKDINGMGIPRIVVDDKALVANNDKATMAGVVTNNNVDKNITFSIVDGKIDLRDRIRPDIVALIRNGTRTVDNIKNVMMPVGLKLLTEEEYIQEHKLPWWRNTVYQTPVIIIKGLIVLALMISIPYAAIRGFDYLPEKYRGKAKDKQSTTGSG